MADGAPVRSVERMTQTNPSVLSIRGATKIYGTATAPVTALDGVDLDIAAGRFTAIMGPSGSGKSTLMNLAAGLDDPTSGEVWLDQHPLHRLTDEEQTVLRRTHVGFVFQAYNLVPTLTAHENVLLPFDLAGRTVSSEDRAWIDRLMTDLGLDQRRDHRPRPAVGRTAAAGRHRARARIAAPHRHRRRTDRQPRHALVAGGPRPPARTRSTTTARRSRWSATILSRRRERTGSC